MTGHSVTGGNCISATVYPWDADGLAAKVTLVHADAFGQRLDLRHGGRWRRNAMMGQKDSGGISDVQKSKTYERIAAAL